MHWSSLPVSYIRPALCKCFRLNINFTMTLTLSLISPINLHLPRKSLHIHPSRAFGPLRDCGPSCRHCPAPSHQSLACSRQPLSIPDPPPVESRNPSCLAFGCLRTPSGFNPHPSDFASDLRTLYLNPRTSRPTSWTFVSTSGTPFPLLGPSGRCPARTAVTVEVHVHPDFGPPLWDLCGQPPASCQPRPSGSPASVYSTRPGQPQI